MQYVNCKFSVPNDNVPWLDRCGRTGLIALGCITCKKRIPKDVNQGLFIEKVNEDLEASDE